MLVSVFLVWETTLIKFKSSFSLRAHNNLLIIGRIIEDTRFLFTFIDSVFSEIRAKEVPDFYVFASADDFLFTDSEALTK